MNIYSLDISAESLELVFGIMDNSYRSFIPVSFDDFSIIELTCIVF